MAPRIFRYIIALSACLALSSPTVWAEIPQFVKAEKCIREAIKDESKKAKPNSVYIINKCKVEIDSLMAILPKGNEKDPKFDNQKPLIIGKREVDNGSTK